MKIKHIKDEQLQNYILNKIEEAYMLKNNLYSKEDLLGQPMFEYNYKALREAVAEGNLGKGYYELVRLFEQQEVRGVKDD